MSGPSDKEYLPKRWVKCDVEAEYFGEDRKASKMDRKKASAKDRSKYKKTDKKHLKGKEFKQSKENLLRGRVLTITLQGFAVQYEDEIIVCSLRGVLKKERGQFKNLVAVGDFVLFEKASEDEGFIVHVEPRQTILSRADNLSRRREQLIAVNIDQVIITTSVVLPPLKPSLIDRYIIAAYRGGMTPIIVVNKIDLLEDPSIDPQILEREKEMYEEFLDAYTKAKIHIIPMSVLDQRGIDELKKAMENKASVFSGQSGVGKSSIINVIAGQSLKIGKLVDKTKKGSHTTTTAQLLPLDFGGWCIDTPGIKSFGVWDLKKEDVEAYFSEIHETGAACRYPNCSHLVEEDCAVLRAVESGEISFLRYQSYLALMESLSREHVRR